MRRLRWLVAGALLLSGCASDSDKGSEGFKECRDTDSVYLCGLNQLCHFGACVNESNDDCGSVGNSCINGNVCIDGACVCQSSNNEYCSLTCTSLGCVDPNTNPSYCGKEGKACDVGKGEKCADGVCLTQCPTNLTDCSTVCADVDNDVNHCGECGNKCVAAGTNHVSRSYCQRGDCQIVCDANWIDEDGDASNGCEKEVTFECGNGVVERGEACDGLKLNDQTCATLVGEGSTGVVFCSPDCQSFDTSDCSPSTTCGNGRVDDNEVCDGASLNGATCEMIRGEGSKGHLGCQANCAGFDVSECSAPTTCGNGKLDVGESCDGTLMNNATCESVRGVGSTGTLKCTSSCEFDISGCGMPAVCGNGIVEAGEACDGANFNGATCASIVGAGSTGTLICSSCKTILTEHCSAPSTCGNGKADADEKCDGADLKGMTCESVVGLGSKGTLRCASNCGNFDISGCTAPSTCGDGVVQANEVCDGERLNDKTCATEVGNGSTGRLKCNLTCTGFDVSDCTASTTCGNGVLEVGEVCDRANVRGATCESEVGKGSRGTVLCGSDCTYLNLSGCSAATACGNGKLDDGEVCDGKAGMADVTCASAVGEGSKGTVSCGDGCKHIDVTKCSAPTTCGNGKLDAGEVCDGTLLNSKTCSDVVGFGSKGVLACNSTCSGFDTSRCSAEVLCGNGRLDPGETCDGTMLNGATCSALVGYGSVGTPVCNGTCTGYVTEGAGYRGCSAAVKCGNGSLDEGEACDGYNLNEKTCEQVVGFGSTGTPTCNSTCTGFNRGSCTAAKTCGNGKLDAGEQCDSAFLNGATCESVVGKGSTGTLLCDGNCRYNTTNCTPAPTCGNGKLDPGEQCDGKAFIDDISSCKAYAPSVYSGGTLKCTESCTIDVSSCTAYCGNGKINTSVGGVAINEACDGMRFPTSSNTCEKVVGPGSTGTLVCSDDCKSIITKNCTAAAVCGDGKINQSTEQCDGTAFKNGVADCSAYSSEYESGTNVTCLGNCTVDTSMCKKKVTAYCGDGEVNGDEECDGTKFLLDMDECKDWSNLYSSGKVTCNPSTCKVEYGACVKASTAKTCGNNVREGDEECDGADMPMENCADYSADDYSGGKLSCTKSCKIDESACVKKVVQLCGNGVIDDGEVCDGKILPFNYTACNKYDSSLYFKGTVKCSADCKSIDVSACATYCGNGAVNASKGEECDGAKFQQGKNTCAKVVGVGSTGTLKCTDSCKLDTSGCSAANICGDNKVDDGEDCDGTKFFGDETSCKEWSSIYESGTVSCNKDCTVNFDACVAKAEPVCGDNVVNQTSEECDGRALSSMYSSWNCSEFGSEYVGGTMTCDKNCKLDTGSCVLNPNAKCGNNQIDDKEECDGTAFIDEAALCSDWDEVFVSGKLSCNADCTVNTSACAVNRCGDGVVRGDEECDKTNFVEGWDTCEKVDSSFSGGKLSCNADCTINTDACIRKCGNGKLDADEFCDPNHGNPIFDPSWEKCSDWIDNTTGKLGCTATCDIDFSQCIAKPTAYCGDGVLNTSSEECDGSAFMNGKKTCNDYNGRYVSGNLKCTNGCKLDLSDCKAPACGDGELGADEECDGDKFMFGIKTCAEYSETSYKGGMLKCTDKCRIDTSACVSAGSVCGNGELEEDEFCDGTKFIDGQDDCSDWGDFAGGKVTCSATCDIVTTACVKKNDARCGDGKVNVDGEDCDGSAFLADVTSCVEYDDKTYSAGTLKCTKACKYDFSGCTEIPKPACGNNVVDGDEMCDGDKFYGDIKTCAEYSDTYNRGNLKCTDSCTVDTSECSAVDLCKDGDTRCVGNSLQMCGKDNGKPAAWVEMLVCASNKVCNPESETCDDAGKVVNLQWCTFHWLDVANAVGYGRILMPSGKTADDVLGYMACTQDLSLPVNQWKSVDADVNASCSDCGLNTEFMSQSYIKNAPVGTNYCTFIFDFVDEGVFACQPRQSGESAPTRIQPATKLTADMTRSFVKAAPATECTENAVKCEGNVSYLCDSGKWEKMYDCIGDVPVCNPKTGECEKATAISYDNSVDFSDLKANANYTNAPVYSFGDGSELSFGKVAIYETGNVIDGKTVIMNGQKGSGMEIKGLTNGIGTLSFDYRIWPNDGPVSLKVTAGSETKTVEVKKTDTATKTATLTFASNKTNTVKMTMSSTSKIRVLIDNVRFTNSD